jgi:hypothetical protein
MCSVQVHWVVLSVFSVFKLIPFPIYVGFMESRLTPIFPEKKFIVLDNIKGFYTKLEQRDFLIELGNCA